MEQKFFNFIGLGAKANKIVKGTAECMQRINNNNVYLLIIDINASDKTKKEFSFKCESKNIPIIITKNEFKLGYSIGNPNILTVAVTDQNFANEALIKYNMCSGGANIE